MGNERKQKDHQGIIAALVCFEAIRTLFAKGANYSGLTAITPQLEKWGKDAARFVVEEAGYRDVNTSSLADAFYSLRDSLLDRAEGACAEANVVLVANAEKAGEEVVKEELEVNKHSPLAEVYQRIGDLIRIKLDAQPQRPAPVHRPAPQPVRPPQGKPVPRASGNDKCQELKAKILELRGMVAEEAKVAGVFGPKLTFVDFKGATEVSLREGLAKIEGEIAVWRTSLPAKQPAVAAAPAADVDEELRERVHQMRAENTALSKKHGIKKRADLPFDFRLEGEALAAAFVVVEQLFTEWKLANGIVNGAQANATPSTPATPAGNATVPN